MDVADFRAALVGWIDENRSELAPPYDGHGSTEELLAHQRHVQRILFESGWSRWGWPERVGGLGGTPLFRAVLGEELTSRGLVHSATYSMPEVLGPAIEQFAAPDLAARVLPAMLRGEEQWCQGFSEPDAGSDLGSMRTTGTVDGDAWVVSGQKLWTSWAQYASRCVLLARTGPPDSGSRGITAFFVDMDSPGITVRPLRTMAGIDEFCETFFDQVRIPSDRVIGAVDDGWRVAQHILACERGAIFWQRAGWLLHHLDEIVQDPAADDEASARVIGHAYADVFAFRSCSRSTQAQVAIGDLRAAETSVDKILIAKADQAVFDACRQVLDGAIELDDSTAADRFRKEWIYSRAATIYGGTSEIQREIVASRLLKMPRTT